MSADEVTEDSIMHSVICDDSEEEVVEFEDDIYNKKCYS